MNRDVFLSLLALDSYNRGYGANVEVSGAKGSKIGTAVIGEDAETLLADGAAQEAGFYAIAYNWNGETIISYRGTNFPAELSASQLLEFRRHNTKYRSPPPLQSR